MTGGVDTDGSRPPASPRRPRVALVFGNTAEYNSRARRMATTLAGAGCEVVLVARAGHGLPHRERHDGYEIVRVELPESRWFLAPSLPDPEAAARPGSGLARVVREGPGRAIQAARYLVQARRWAEAIERAVSPADAWQADGLVALPVALALRGHNGGRVVYDALEIHVESGRFARLPGPWRALLSRSERSWARAADAVITVSRAYAGVIGPRLGVEPQVVMNCPPAPAAEPVSGDARPRRFHEALGLPAEAPVVLYHGYAFPHRGIERLFEAIALVPGAHLVVMGMGPRLDAYRSAAAALPHADRVHVMPGVPPGQLLDWVASADVAAMPIDGSTLNHRLTTPNKLFEAIAAGVPVVASDLPGMAPIVRETGAGLLCDPADPRDVARAIRAILDAPPAERAAYRAHALAAARGTYNWERQATAYLAVYRQLGLIG